MSYSPFIYFALYKKPLGGMQLPFRGFVYFVVEILIFLYYAYDWGFYAFFSSLGDMVNVNNFN